MGSLFLGPISLQQLSHAAEVTTPVVSLWYMSLLSDVCVQSLRTWVQASVAGELRLEMYLVWVFIQRNETLI